MSAIDRYFAEYAAFHGDGRNELTHMVGIPAIILALLMWAGRLRLAEVGGLSVDLGWVLIALVAGFYLTLSLPLGVAAAAALALMHALGAALGRNAWLALGLFAAGWALQFVGHHFEGKRPAFLKNGMHLLIGPLWILNRLLERAGLPVGSPSR
jgi:uncharacterized membrane protein YGL010W